MYISVLKTCTICGLGSYRKENKSHKCFRAPSSISPLHLFWGNIFFFLPLHNYELLKCFASVNSSWRGKNPTQTLPWFVFVPHRYTYFTHKAMNIQLSVISVAQETPHSASYATVSLPSDEAPPPCTETQPLGGKSCAKNPAQRVSAESPKLDWEALTKKTYESPSWEASRPVHIWFVVHILKQKGSRFETVAHKWDKNAPKSTSYIHFCSCIWLMELTHPSTKDVFTEAHLKRHELPRVK